MESTRQRQQREIVDEDKNLSRRVFDLNVKQVKAFNESVLPKQTKDIQSEIAVDKLLEGLQRLLESKTVALETLLSRAGQQKEIKAEFRDAYSRIVMNGDVVSLYNQIIAILNSNLSTVSYDSIKVKLQELKPNVDAIDYGLGQLIQLFFEAGVVDVKQIARLVQAQAVYRLIRNQLNTTQYRLINPPEIQVSVREVLAELSEFQRVELNYFQNIETAEDKSLLNLPIVLDQNKQRIEALESELGFQLPFNLKKRLDRLQPSDEKEAFENIKASPELAQGTSLASLQSDYERFKKENDDESTELEQSIPALRRRLIKMRLEYLKLKKFIQSIPEEKGGEYDNEARGEIEKLDELYNEMENVKAQLDSQVNRQKEILINNENIKKQYDLKRQEIENFSRKLPYKLRKRFGSEPEPDFVSPPPKPRRSKVSSGKEEENKYDDLEGEGRFMYDDERNDIYKE